MKEILRHITSFYLIAFVLLSSIAVPYTAMSCKISNEFSLSFMQEKKHCGEEDSCTKSSEDSFEKSECCLFNNGVIDIDTELVQYDVNEFISYIPVSLTYSVLPVLQEDNKFIEDEIFVHLLRHVPIRIAFQSFLC